MLEQNNTCRDCGKDLFDHSDVQLDKCSASAQRVDSLKRLERDRLLKREQQINFLRKSE